MPKLTGRPYEQARRDLDALGLSVRIAGETTSAVYDPMVVVSQSPPPDSRVLPGGMVEVWVSRGPDKVLVDSVVGTPVPDAKARLESSGLQVTETDEWSDQVPPGAVVSQKPEAGDLVAPGSVVGLVVSKGPEPATPTPQTVRPPEGDSAWVPDVVRLPEAEARRRIELAGLTNTWSNYQSVDDVPASLREFFLSVPVGSVLSTSPLPGTKLHKNDVVRIAVRRQ